MNHMTPPSAPFPERPTPQFPKGICVGSIIPYAGDIDPDTCECKMKQPYTVLNFSASVKNTAGWILCDGQEVDIALAPELFSVIGFLYGKGSTDSRFKVPDYRGYFLRGLAVDNSIDKGYEEREKNPDTSTEEATNKGVGSVQGCMVQKHMHHYTNFSDLKAKQLGPGDAPTNGPTDEVFTKADVYNESKAQMTGNETRPVNIYVNYLIYAGI